jgi:hypothetical protein
MADIQNSTSPKTEQHRGKGVSALPREEAIQMAENEVRLTFDAEEVDGQDGQDNNGNGDGWVQLLGRVPV